MIVEQGYTMDRPSRIEALVQGDRVRVSGAAVVVAGGTLRG
jgi:predicted PhzF superfamily epimerase YddE/YHI9